MKQTAGSVKYAGFVYGLVPVKAGFYGYAYCFFMVRSVFQGFMVFAFVVFAACGISNGQKPDKSAGTAPVLFDSGNWATPSLTGVVLASRFNHHSERQYEQLRQRAETELHSASLTSVHVAWYGMNEQPIREWAEFAILDERPLAYTTLDSVYAGSLLIYRIAESSSASAENAETTGGAVCEIPAFGQRDIAETPSCWHARARIPYSVYDAHPALVNGKQNAMTTLAQHLGIKVQQMERQGRVLDTITHQYVKYIFRDIQVSRLIIDEHTLDVRVSVPKSRIIQL